MEILIKKSSIKRYSKLFRKFSIKKGKEKRKSKREYLQRLCQENRSIRNNRENYKKRKKKNSEERLKEQIHNNQQMRKKMKIGLKNQNQLLRK